MSYNSSKALKAAIAHVTQVDVNQIERKSLGGGDWIFFNKDDPTTILGNGQATDHGIVPGRGRHITFHGYMNNLT